MIKKQITILMTVFAALIIVCTVPTLAHAQNATPPAGRSQAENDCKPDGSGNISSSNCGIVKLLNTVLNGVSGVIALAVIGNIIWAGIQYSTAQGDPSATSKSKKRITDAVIAFIMYLCLYAFMQWLIPGGVFG